MTESINRRSLPRISGEARERYQAARSMALLAGRQKFETADPCLRCGGVVRYTRNGVCIRCTQHDCDRRRAALKAGTT